MTSLNYYKILRLSPSATPKEITASYRNLCILYRDSRNATAKEIMKLIDEAYSVLRDPRYRAEYDLEMQLGFPEDRDEAELSKAEKIINSWGQRFTDKEKAHVDKVRVTNQLYQIALFIGAILFVWSVITSRHQISILLLLVVQRDFPVQRDFDSYNETLVLRCLEALFSSRERVRLR